MKQLYRAAALIGSVLVCGSLIGCVAYPQAPPPPPPPRALTVSAQNRQSQARQDKDRADCQSMASAQGTSSESWAQVFTGCMSGRGYMVQ